MFCDNLRCPIRAHGTRHDARAVDPLLAEALVLARDQSTAISTNRAGCACVIPHGVLCTIDLFYGELVTEDFVRLLGAWPADDL